jgi:hypothetical protein
MIADWFCPTDAAPKKLEFLPWIRNQVATEISYRMMAAMNLTQF